MQCFVYKIGFLQCAMWKICEDYTLFLTLCALPFFVIEPFFHTLEILASAGEVKMAPSLWCSLDSFFCFLISFDVFYVDCDGYKRFADDVTAVSARSARAWAVCCHARCVTLSKPLRTNPQSHAFRAKVSQSRAFLFHVFNLGRSRTTFCSKMASAMVSKRLLRSLTLK